MPLFGNYQTIREIASDDSRAVYLAESRQKPSEQPYYVVVVFRVRKATEHYERDDQGIRNLGQDLQLAFLSTVKAQKSASDAGSPFVAPIYDLGVNSEGAWYATDYFRRGSIETGIGNNDVVDDAFLRRVVGFIVAGLRDLEKHAGRSHGNLKPTKIMLAGKTSRLRSSTLQLIEPLIGTEADAIHFEHADLRSLGCVLYQLITSREVSSPDEIGYPVQISRDWLHLGEQRGYWLELCNKLLADPPERSLEDLAREFPPPKPPPVAALSGVAVTAALAFLFLWFHFSPLFALPTDALKRFAGKLGNGRAANYLRAKSEYAASLQEARDQADIGEFANARGWLTNALLLHFNDAQAERSLKGIIAQQTKYDQWVAAIQYFTATGKYADVVRACKNARVFAPKAPQFDAWQNRASQLAEAMDDFKAGHYATAERKLAAMWQANPLDDTAKELRDKSARCDANWAAFNRTKQRDALEAVLKDNPADPRAKEELKLVLDQAVAYVDYLKKAQLHTEGGEYAKAVAELEGALAIHSDTELKGRLEEAKTLKTLHEKADLLFTQQDWSAAENEYAELFRRNPKDTLAETRLRECLRAATTR